MTEREARFLRVHKPRPLGEQDPVIVHIGFGCAPGKYRVMANIPIPKADPVS